MDDESPKPSALTKRRAGIRAYTARKRAYCGFFGICAIAWGYMASKADFDPIYCFVGIVCLFWSFGNYLAFMCGVYALEDFDEEMG